MSRGPTGALLVGSPDEVVDKISRYHEALGGISRPTFQMNAASLPQIKMMRAIDTIAARVAPALHQEDVDQSQATNVCLRRRVSPYGWHH